MPRKKLTTRQRVMASYHGKKGKAFIREYDRRLRVMRRKKDKPTN